MRGCAVDAFLALTAGGKAGLEVAASRPDVSRWRHAYHSWRRSPWRRRRRPAAAHFDGHARQRCGRACRRLKTSLGAARAARTAARGRAALPPRSVVTACARAGRAVGVAATTAHGSELRAGLLGIFGCRCTARVSDLVSYRWSVWCPAARCCRLRRVVCLCVGSHRNSHCVRTAGAAGWVRRSARTLPVGRVVVYARVVVCEDYLTNTLINTQRGVSPSPLARGTERVKHHLSRAHRHTDPMCRARPALPPCGAAQSTGAD